MTVDVKVTVVSAGVTVADVDVTVIDVATNAAKGDGGGGAITATAAMEDIRPSLT